jgi:hypothetical protein
MGRKLNLQYRTQLADRLGRPKCIYCGQRGRLTGDSHRKCRLIASKSPADLLIWYHSQKRDGPPAWAINPVLAWVDEMCAEAEQKKLHAEIRNWWL